MRKYLIALGMALALGGAAVWFTHGATSSAAPRPAADLADFSDWAVVLAAGDDHAHSGAPSKVFDNARHDLAGAFAKLGFKPSNMVQFSVDHDEGTQDVSVPDIAAAMQAVAARAKTGCLIYFTSHGTPYGMVIGDAILTPVRMRDMVDNACGSRPAVIVMSSCYSGQFVEPLKADNRIVMTASRPDRTSFGCGELDHYTFFDDCFLRALPLAGDFPGLGGLVQQCVAFREQQMKAAPPSEPQLSVGPKTVFTLRWRDAPPLPAVPPGNQPT